MKKVLFIMILVLTSNGVFGQSFYDVKSIGSSYSSQTINEAFQAADFCGFYLSSNRNKLVFDDGSEVELKSRTEIINEGNYIADACILNEGEKIEVVIWSITSSGKILRGSKAPLSSSQKVITED